MKSPLHAHLWDRHPDDWYVEPEWCSRRLFDVHRFNGEIHDPACGLGRIVKSAREAGHKASGGDIITRSEFCETVRDFTGDDFEAIYDNIVCNPPFGLCDDQDGIGYPFVTSCFQHCRDQVALLLPIKWLGGNKRSRWLQRSPLARILFIAPRPSMPPGPVIDAGIAPGGGKEDYAWLIWQVGYKGEPAVGWCRRDE